MNYITDYFRKFKYTPEQLDRFNKSGKTCRQFDFILYLETNERKYLSINDILYHSEELFTEDIIPQLLGYHDKFCKIKCDYYDYKYIILHPEYFSDEKFVIFKNMVRLSYKSQEIMSQLAPIIINFLSCDSFIHDIRKKEKYNYDKYTKKWVIDNSAFPLEKQLFLLEKLIDNEEKNGQFDKKHTEYIPMDEIYVCILSRGEHRYDKKNIDIFCKNITYSIYFYRNRNITSGLYKQFVIDRKLPCGKLKNRYIEFISHIDEKNLYPNFSQFKGERVAEQFTTMDGEIAIIPFEVIIDINLVKLVENYCNLEKKEIVEKISNLIEYIRLDDKKTINPQYESIAMRLVESDNNKYENKYDNKQVEQKLHNIIHYLYNKIKLNEEIPYEIVENINLINTGSGCSNWEKIKNDEKLEKLIKTYSEKLTDEEFEEMKYRYDNNYKYFYKNGFYNISKIISLVMEEKDIIG